MRKVKETAQKHTVQKIRQNPQKYSPKKKNRLSWTLGEPAFELGAGICVLLLDLF